MGNSISRALLIRRILEAIGTLSTAPCFRFRMTRSAIANETTRKRKAIVTTADEPTSKRRHIPEPDLLPNIAENIKRKTDTAANLSDGDTPDAKLQRPDEIPHASDDIPAPSMKRKRDTAIDLADSDTPDAKRRRLEEALDAHLGNAAKSLFILPNELLYSVISFLGVKELRTCTKVSTLLRDIASPSFLAAVHFTPAQTPYWLSVDQKHCEALLVWSRMASFTPPKNLFFSAAQDIHLRALNIFIRAPRAANIPAVYLSCHGDSICMVLAATVLESLRASGCREISYSHSSATRQPRLILPKPVRTTPSRLKSFAADTNTIFSPPIISFTMDVLHNSRLKELSLKNTGLSPSMWGNLLRSLHLPHMRILEVDRECPIKVILEFLQRHPLLEFLDIVADGGKQEPRYLGQYPSVKLSALRHVGGPPAYVAALGRHLQTPRTVTSLSLSLIDIPPSHRQLSSVLNSTERFPCLYNVTIAFHHTRSIPATSLLFPSNEGRICRAQQLRITCPSGAVTDHNDEAVKRCGSWLQAFPDVRNVKLVPNNTDDAEEIRQNYMTYAPRPDELRLAISRIWI